MLKSETMQLSTNENGQDGEVVFWATQNRGNKQTWIVYYLLTYIRKSHNSTSLFRILRKVAYAVGQSSVQKYPCKGIDVPFASQGDDSPIVSILVRLLLNLCRE